MAPNAPIIIYFAIFADLTRDGAVRMPQRVRFYCIPAATELHGSAAKEVDVKTHRLMANPLRHIVGRVPATRQINEISAWSGATISRRLHKADDFDDVVCHP